MFHSSPTGIVEIDSARAYYGQYLTGFSHIEFGIVDIFGQGDKTHKTLDVQRRAYRRILLHCTNWQNGFCTGVHHCVVFFYFSRMTKIVWHPNCFILLTGNSFPILKMKQSLFLFACVFGCSIAKAQTMDACQAFNYFLSSDSVRSMLAFDNNKTSWLHDPTGLLGKDNCSTGYESNHRFQWIGESVALKQRSKNCAYYYVSCTRKGNGWFIEIWQACSGLVCQGVISKNKQKIEAASFVVFAR